MHDEPVDERRQRAEPRAEVRDHLGQRDPRAEEQRVLLRVRQQPGRGEDPDPDARADADDQRERELPAHVRRERVLHAAEQRQLATSRRIAAVDRAAEPLHVEEHVDRDHDQQHDREERLADRDRGAFDERDDALRVLADVALLDLAHDSVAALLNVDSLQVVRVQPVLEAVDVAVGGCLSGGRDTIREVLVESVGSRLRLTDDSCRDRHDDKRQRRRERQQHDRDRKAAREPDPLERPDERIEQERDERGDEEEEDDMTRRRQEHPREDQQERQAHQLDPARHLNARRAAEGAHRNDATARVVPIRPPDWDWSFSTDGALALAPALNYPEQSATVPRMPPPGPHRRARAARRRPLQRERRLRRARCALRDRPRGARDLAPVRVRRLGRPGSGTAARECVAPAPRRAAAAGDRRPDRLAAPAAARLAEPRHGDRLPGRQRRLARASTRSARQANQGLLRRLAHSIFGGSSGGARWYQLPGGQGPATSALQVGARGGHRRLLARRRHRARRSGTSS